MSSRKMKKEILQLLSTGDFEKNIGDIVKMPGQQAANALFPLLYHREDKVRWHTVSAMGAVVSALADTDVESARNIMRRFMWNLNDESGGIGWGSPEAMGEITARHAKMADEFSKILRSYIMPDGNFLEHELLQNGVLWGLARLAGTRPGHVTDAGPHILPFLASKDPMQRALAILSSQAIKNRAALSLLEGMTRDEATVQIYGDLTFNTFSIGELAASALSSMA